MFLQDLYVHVYKDCLRKWCFQNKQTKTSNDQTVDIAYYIHTYIEYCILNNEGLFVLS